MSYYPKIRNTVMKSGVREYQIRGTKFIKSGVRGYQIRGTKFIKSGARGYQIWVRGWLVVVAV